MPVSVPMLQEEALIIACSLGINDFKASNGWLQRFKGRNNIKQLVVSGESGDVNEETVTAWRERLVTLVRGYSPKDIWNEDETCLVAIKRWYRFRGLVLLVVAKMERTDRQTHTHEPSTRCACAPRVNYYNHT